MENRIRWKPAEWKLICKELLLHHPMAMHSKTLGTIKPRHVEEAMQKVLPKDRWRASMNMAQIRPILKEQLHEVDLEMQAAKKPTPETLIKIGDIEQIADKVFGLLKPMLEGYLKTRINGGTLQEAEVAAKTMLTKEVLKVRKFRIGILGLIPIQQQEIIKSFPTVDFSFVESGNKNQEIRGKMHGQDLIIGVVGKLRHAAEDTLKSMNVYHLYQQVPGATSSVKRAINLWLHQQETKE